MLNRYRAHVSSSLCKNAISLTPILLLLFFMTTAGCGQLRKIVYTPSNAIFPNPERGLFIGLETTVGERPITRQQLERYLAANVTLLNRYYYLTPHLNGPISRSNLDFIVRDLQTIRAAGMKTILKFAYNKNPRNPVDPEIGTMLSHLDQLAPILRENKDVIAAMQAGFIGSWGEWAFSSRGYQDSTRVQGLLVRKILEVLPKDRMVCIRAIRHKYAIFGKETLTEKEGFSGSDRARLGFHNDGFLKSWDDVGTFYVSGGARDTGATKAYLAGETQYVLMGGESSGPGSRTNCATALAEFQRFHYSYFNRMFEQRVIEGFRREGCWDEIEQRLGYFFRLQTGEFSTSANTGGTFRIRLAIANTGFASPYNPRLVHLIVRNAKSKNAFIAQLPYDPRTWKPGAEAIIDTLISVPETMPAGEYQLLLSLPDPEPGLRTRSSYSIRLANTGVWESSTGYNNLLAALQIGSGKASTSSSRGIPLIPSSKK